MSTQTKQRLILLGLSTLAACGAYVFVLWGTIRSIDEASALAQTLTKKRAQSETFLSLRHIVADTASARKEMDGYFIAKEGVVDFIEQIEKIGNNVGVTLMFTTVDVRKEENSAPSLNTLLLRFSATGSWERVVRFFTLVESLPYALSVTDARIEKQSPLEWRVVVTLSAYKHV